MKRLCLIDVVGLTKPILDRMPFASAWAKSRQISVIKPVVPALTCSMQATYMTGQPPSAHGIVGNGWYFKDTAEVNLWRQSYHLVQKEYLWHDLKRQNQAFTVANIGWWYNMYCGADHSVTPRPQYRANGLKVPDCYTTPANWRDELQLELGQFPLFKYWGPMTSIASSAWLAKAAVIAEKRWKPSLSLLYIPHLDYCFQRNGDADINLNDILEVDKLLKETITELEQSGVQVALISEYGITNVNKPVHINRFLRKQGLLAIREEQGGELLDAGASKAFAVADHQIAHVYTHDVTDLAGLKQKLLALDGVADVWDKSDQISHGLAHERSGDLVVLAAENAWFTYYYWLDDAKAPDFARMVEIHKKPGYDPAELFIDPKITAPKFKLGLKLLARKLGFRNILDVTPLDATLVKGSHGIIPSNQDYWPILVGLGNTQETIEATDVKQLLIDAIS